jgi:hypothetical protein
MLLAEGVRPDRIQVEVFTQVGHAPLEFVPEPRARIENQIQLLLTLGLGAFYLIQSAFDWGLPALAALQQLDGYRIATGSLLLAFIGHQWYLGYLRFTGPPLARISKLLAPTASPWHRYLGVVAPVLLYLHSVSLGVAYTFVLSLLFVLNAMFGALDKTLISSLEHRQIFQRIWLMVHVPSSSMITVLALIHMVYALAYK